MGNGYNAFEMQILNHERINYNYFARRRILTLWKLFDRTLMFFLITGTGSNIFGGELIYLGQRVYMYKKS
jgi:uncharacterized phage-like protein YoqJ